VTQQLRTISYGGGVQSTALCVLAVQGKLDAVIGGPVDVALFSNVGDDSEHPATLAFVREVMTPWAAERGLPIVELQRIKRDGTVETLMGRLTKEGSRSLAIPVRMSNGAPGNRSCTADFKIHVIGKWLKAQGCGKTTPPAIVCIGISVDEVERASRGRDEPYQKRYYPLLNLGLTRSDCERVIRDAGLPVPPKSSCFFCPFHRPTTWAEMRRDEPELFAKSQALEDLLNERRQMLGRDPVWLTRFNRRLSDAISEAQTSLFDDTTGIGETGCDEGVCFV
jgi:hypothetical protein